MTLDELISKQGPLAETFLLFDENTIQYASEITKARRDNRELRSNWFSTADSSLYRIEAGEVVLYFGQRETNLLFRNIKSATEQLLKNNNYKPSKEEIKSVVDSVESGNTLKIKLSELELKGDNDEWLYFEIRVINYESLNSIQRVFAEKIYGKEDDFKKNMKMFKDAKITTPQIYVLNPEYVKKNVEKDSALVRGSSISYFDYESNFYAVAKCVTSKKGALRGVLLVDTKSNK